MTLLTLVLALFLSIPPLWTHARLLVCAGLCLCLFVFVGLYTGSAGGLAFVLVAVNILRESRPPKDDRARSRVPGVRALSARRTQRP